MWNIFLLSRWWLLFGDFIKLVDCPPFYKGDNLNDFQFALLHTKSLLKWGLL